MLKTTKRTALTVALAIILAVVLTTAAAVFAAISPLSENPDVEFVFSGFRMQADADGGVQGLVDLTLKGVDAASVAFTIQYDEDYIAPSNHADNGDLANLMNCPEVFAQNPDSALFPVAESIKASNPYVLTGDPSTLNVTIMPDENVLEPDGANGAISYIQDKENEWEKYYHMAATQHSDGLKLGSLSFKILDPAALSRMTEAQLQDVFSVAANSLVIRYYDTELKKIEEQAIRYTWDVEAVVIDAWPVTTEISVLASELYGVGDERDLVDLLNLNYKRIYLEWSDKSITTDNFNWDFASCTFSTDPDSNPYNPKSGTYTVTQTYMDYGDYRIDLTVTITVVPVNLLRFQIQNQHITYTFDNRPNTFAGLSLPAEATPILDKVVTKYSVPNAAVNALTWSPNDLPADFAAGVFGTYEFDNAIDDAAISALEGLVPWLTTDGAVRDIKAYRTIGEVTPPPLADSITAVVEKLDGYLTIEAAKLDGMDSIPSGTAFRVKFPNGYILDNTVLGTSGTPIMTYEVVGGVATIVINTDDLSDPLQSTLQSYINLGGSGFSLAATAPQGSDGTVYGESDFTSFRFDCRENHHIANGTADFSAEKALFFPAYAGASLSTLGTHITLVGGDSVAIAYDGTLGSEPGALTEAHVVEWKIVGDLTATELPNTPGADVQLVGEFVENHYYSNHGYVTNKDDSLPVYTLTITVTLREGTPPENPDERIKITTNETEIYEQELDETNSFVYDTKKVGYSPSQLQTFTIHNIGADDISGLHVTVQDLTDGITDFVLVGLPDLAVAGETGKTTFSIRPKTGLAPGTTYEARVTVGSDRADDLKHFDIYFTVTDEDVYKVTVYENDPALGTATVVGSTYYTANATVTVEALPILPSAYYTFVEWTSTDPDVVFTNPYNATTTFQMPARDVEVMAHFDETILGKLRLDDLKDLNPDTTENPLRDSDYTIISFDPNRLDYYVTVPYETEQNQILVKPHYPVIDGATIVPAFYNVTAGSAINSADVADANGYFPSDFFGLVVGTNEITITQSYSDGQSLTYTVYIIRRDEVKVDLMYGNSPYGLIEADSVLTRDQKDAAEAYFHTNRRYDQTLLPEGVTTTESETYRSDAWIWPHKDLDEDPYALFVYSGQPFVDPGFKNLYYASSDAASEPVPVDPLDVTRTIKVAKFVDASEPDVATRLSGTADYTDTISAGGESCVVNTFENGDIRPGVYKLVYSFTDSDGFETTFSRSLVVLYPKGDTDDSGAVDTDDYNNLYNRMKNGINAKIFNTRTDWAAVYAYRICDVNTDRNVNSIDANNIKKNQTFTQFYEELPTE